MSPPLRPITMAGAGPTGALLAILLRRRGFPVTLYERRADPRLERAEAGRSINLALAARGMQALRNAGLADRIAPELVPMRGRMLHDRSGATTLQPYGRSPDELIHSISRNRLTEALLREAVDGQGAVVRFRHEITGIDADAARLAVHDLESGRRFAVEGSPLLAADGAGSAVRNALLADSRVRVDVDPLEHGYKELTIPRGPGGSFLLEREALHIWPRGDFMLIALPNVDGSFTVTLFLPHAGEPGFAGLREPRSIRAFFEREFPDVVPLLPALEDQFIANPVGSLATVHTDPWHVGGEVLLLGDAAHAIVPFHGQGMNCCFEDCIEFDRAIDAFADWRGLFAAFAGARKPNTEAIAAMAIENYLEMRARVVEPRFQLQKALSLELERRHPARFVPRYSMVSFRHDIGYATAARRGAIQQRILEELTADARSLAEIDYAAAAIMIERRLPPLGPDPDAA